LPPINWGSIVSSGIQSGRHQRVTLFR